MEKESPALRLLATNEADGVNHTGGVANQRSQAPAKGDSRNVSALANALTSAEGDSRSVPALASALTSAEGDSRGVPTSAGPPAPARVEARPSTILLANGVGRDQEFVRKVLGDERYRLYHARDTGEVLETLKAKAVDLVILSQHSDAMDGLECCRRIKTNRKTELIPVLMVTSDETRSQIQALSAGADDVLCPPAHPELARTQVQSLLRQKAATDRLEQTEEILFSLAQTVEARDHATGGHCERLSLFSLALGMALQLSDEDLLALHRGGYLHDIGKVAVPDQVLNKPGPLDDREWEVMRTHTVRGEEICRPLRSLERVLPIIRNHHEKWDGGGYPDGLKGEQIPLLARVLQLSDIFDALTNERPYKAGLPVDTALDIMREETQRGWRDPELMEAFQRLHESVNNKTGWRDAQDMQQSLRNLQQHLVES
jgi:putative two-component system response regulator